MDEPFEIELKLEYSPADRAAIMAAAALAGAEPQTQQLVSTYYDTADGLLARNGFSLRVRRIGDRFVQTVKADGAPAAGLFARPEWEMALAGPEPQIDAGSSPIAPLLGDRPLAPVFASIIDRTTWTIDFEDSRIEVALDAGEVRAGARTRPINDLELELKTGSAGALFALARRLGGAAPLRLGVLGKSERGRSLPDDPGGQAIKAEPILLDADADGRAAFATIARACLRQFRLNEALVIDGGDAAALHQARVALRRLRSAFSLFAPLLAGDLTAMRLQGDLKWLAGTLGAVRDLDVLIRAQEGAVRERLIAVRVEALARVQATLADPRARALMLDLAEWLAVGGWRTTPHDAADIPVRQLATDLLDRSRKRLKRRGRDLATCDDAHRHRARIAAKKLRYASEFFAALWDDGKGRRRHREFVAALERLQDRLGMLNDMATAPRILAQHGLTPAEHPDHADRGNLIRRAAAAYERLMDMKRFWR